MTRLLVLLAVVLLATPALAQDVQRVETERTLILELRLGLDYYPAIDKEKGLSGPVFSRYFGKDERLFPQLTVEKIFFDRFGTLSAGLGIGYSEFYGYGFFEDDPGVRSGDSTYFRVLPLYGLASYRFDWAAQNLGVPLTPFAKAGAGEFFWWATGDSGTRGGWFWSGGLALLLDPLDPRLAREFDADVGVNNSYFTVEYTDWTVDGFGSKGFDLSDQVVSLGLALEF